MICEPVCDYECVCLDALASADEGDDSFVVASGPHRSSPMALRMYSVESTYLDTSPTCHALYSKLTFLGLLLANQRLIFAVREIYLGSKCTRQRRPRE